MKKVFVSVYPYALADPTLRNYIEQQGFKVSYNPYPRKLKPEETCEMAKDCDAVIAGTESLVPLVNATKSLRFISRVGIGLDSVPLQRCREKGITVSYTPDAVTPAVCELTVGLMISLLRGIHTVSQNLQNGIWDRHIGRRIGESTIGIIGGGRVGTGIIRLLTGFSPKQILVNDITDKSRHLKQLAQETGISLRQCTFSEVLKQSDLVSLHVPLTRRTHRLIGHSQLSAMRRGTFLINTSRGGVVDENALYESVSGNHLAGAAVDVFEQEPYTGILSRLPQIITTAHIGSCSQDCRKKMEQQATQAVIHFFQTGNALIPIPENEYNTE